MTGEFSRRSFLKYTALTTVAVAGSSLLSGCEYGYNPVQHAPGTSNVVLKVRSTLDWVEYNEYNNTTAFRLAITCGRKNALEVTKANFAVAERYLAYQNDKLQVTFPDALSHQVKQGETVTCIVFAKDLNALTDGPMTLTYYPDLQYSEFSANWELAADVLEPELPGTSTN